MRKKNAQEFKPELSEIYRPEANAFSIPIIEAGIAITAMVNAKFGSNSILTRKLYYYYDRSFYGHE